MQTLLACLLMVQFAVIVLHDWIDIPGWNYGSQVQRVIGRRKLAAATAINALFPGTAVAFGLYFWNQTAPSFVRNYWGSYCGITVLSAFCMWYVPYLFGGSEESKREYAQMYEGTRYVLPARNGHRGPNVLHVCFHLLFLINLSLAIGLRLRAQ